MAASMKMTIFWDVVTCSLVEVRTALMMEAASTSETSVNLYQTIWCNIPEDSHLEKLPVQTNCAARVFVFSLYSQHLHVPAGWQACSQTALIFYWRPCHFTKANGNLGAFLDNIGKGMS
jgi:hypothetical protein